MNRSNTTKTLEELAQDIDAIADECIKIIQKKLLNLVEQNGVKALQSTIQKITGSKPYNRQGNKAQNTVSKPYC